MGARCRWAQRNRILSGGFWHAVNFARIHNVYDGSTKTLWQLNVGSWGVGGSGSDGEGVRLAQLRGEQACNTNQGDLVMDRRRTESPLCLLIICEECDGSSWLSPIVFLFLPFCRLQKRQQKKCGYCVLYIPADFIKSRTSRFRRRVSTCKQNESD